MALPKIQSPVFEIPIPSLNRKVDFRPFLVKEEKILLMAQQAESDREVVKAIMQIVNNCCLDSTVKIKDLTMTDLEFLFLRIRAKSVNNIVEVKYIDQEDLQEYKFQIDLENINVIAPPAVSNKIEIGGGVGMILKLPPASIIDDMGEFKDEIEVLNFFVKKCIVQVYDEDSVYIVDEESDTEIQTFIDSLSIGVFEKVKEFMDSAPKLSYVINYTNTLDTKREIVLDTLRDFFTLD